MKTWFDMHYVICYDLEDDRLRASVAKILVRHGCERLQKSVFLAAHLPRRPLSLLLAALRRLLLARPLQPADSIVVIPLSAAGVAEIQVFGLNKVDTALADLPLKIVL